MTKQERLLGKAVIDFANAETTDKACFQHFRNMQHIMGFPHTFGERAKNVFPSLVPFKVLRKLEKELIELITKERESKNHLNENFKNLNDYYLEDYDCKNMTLFFRQIKYMTTEVDGEVDFDVFEGEQFRVHLNEIEYKSRERFGEALELNILRELHGLMEIGKKMIELKSSLADSRIKKLYELAEQYPKTVYIHQSIAQIQKDLRDILRKITKGKRLQEIPIFSSFLHRYNQLPKSKVNLTDKDDLTPVLPIDETDYLGLDQFTGNEYPTEWPERFRDDLVFCLIEYLIPEKNRKYIYRCLRSGPDFFSPGCHKYYIPKKLYKTPSGLYFCSDKCRYKYYHSKPEYKEKKAAARRMQHGWQKRVHAK